MSNNNQHDDGGSRRNSLTNTTVTSSTRNRNNSYAAPAGTALFNTDADGENDGDQMAAMGAGNGNISGSGISQRHSIAAIRMSSTRIPRIVETSEHSSAISTSIAPDLTAADPSQMSLANNNNGTLLSAMPGRSSSHRNASGRERVLPANDGFEVSASVHQAESGYVDERCLSF